MNPLLDGEEDAARLWAEIHLLRAAVAGPEGHASWQDAATDERIRRVAAERNLAAAVAAERERWVALCAGKRHEGCHYVATCGAICNKCGSAA